MLKKIKIEWCIEDVLSMDIAKDNNLTELEASEVLSAVQSKHDPCIGINWDVLGYWVQEVIDERGKE